MPHLYQVARLVTLHLEQDHTPQETIGMTCIAIANTTTVDADLHKLQKTNGMFYGRRSDKQAAQNFYC
jgi:hypothetical protein